MSKPIPSYLKLHVEPSAELHAPRLDEIPVLDEICRTFALATGWPLNLSRERLSRPNVVWSKPLEFDGASKASELVVTRDTDERGKRLVASQESAIAHAEAIAAILLELERARRAVWQREAELAAGVPVVARRDDAAHLARRLQAVLQGGAEAVGCQAAALYLLDDATTQLKLRAAWGLPKQRLLEAGRPLRGAVADLEALVGHAVVLQDTSLLPHWKTPEDFSAAVCVPVASDTTILGTLWFFADRVRDFTTEQTNLIEIVAGRMAAELERETLIRQGVASKRFDEQLSRGAEWQLQRLPSFAPLVDDWQVAGWTEPSDTLGGSFHDWSVLLDGRLALSVGRTDGPMLDAALGAATLQSMLKSHACYRHEAHQMLERMNETWWTVSPGGQLASLLYATIQPDSGEMEFAAAGQVEAFAIRGSDCNVVTERCDAIGAQPEFQVKTQQEQIAPGDVLLFISEGPSAAACKDDLAGCATELAKALCAHADDSAEQLAAAARDVVESGTTQDIAVDCSLVVIRRCR